MNEHPRSVFVYVYNLRGGTVKHKLEYFCSLEASLVAARWSNRGYQVKVYH